MSAVLKVLLFVAFLAFCFWLSTLEDARHKAEVAKWAKDNGYEVVSPIEKCVFQTGPFWFNSEDDDIYYAKLRDRQENVRASYFRFGLFRGIEQAWE
jgi:hypothetical protein